MTLYRPFQTEGFCNSIHSGDTTADQALGDRAMPVSREADSSTKDSLPAGVIRVKASPELHGMIAYVPTLSAFAEPCPFELPAGAGDAARAGCWRLLVNRSTDLRLKLRAIATPCAGIQPRLVAT